MRQHHPEKERGRAMEKTLVELSAEEFEELVERAIDRRFNVWLTQLMDALTDLPGEEGSELRPEFAVSLRRALEQARSGDGIDLKVWASSGCV
jgi:hypothetical protein